MWYFCKTNPSPAHHLHPSTEWVSGGQHIHQLWRKMKRNLTIVISSYTTYFSKDTLVEFSPKWIPKYTHPLKQVLGIYRSL